MENVLPNALMIGVDYELFWSLTPTTLEPFIKAFRLKQEYDDMQSWQLGAYIKQAIDSSFSKQAKYPKEPMLSKNKNREATMEEIKSKFMAHAEMLNTKVKG